MIIRWVQHPVGHGGFHTGHLRDAGGGTFNWAFDCGARAYAAFDKQLAGWTHLNQAPLDWLFISHFDRDHVSGLDTLMGSVIVQDVMVPYLNDEELLFILSDELRRGRPNRTIVELVADPAAFFLSRGAERVTFLQGSTRDDETASEPTGPERPPEGELTVKLSKPRRPLPGPNWARQSTSGEPQVAIVEGGRCDVLATRGHLGLRLTPFRAPASAAVPNGAFASAVQALVGGGSPLVHRPGLGQLAYRVAMHARTEAGRKALVALFKSHAGSSNRGSLSLLSIPVASDDRVHWWRSGLSVRWPLHRYPPHWGYERGLPAWLNTGDAELLPTGDLPVWEQCYKPDLPLVQVLALPHHGSDHNSDAKLQALCPTAALVAHVKSSSSKHPGSGVISSAGARLARVTEDHATQVEMVFVA